MKDKILLLHYREYIHLKCCYSNLYDVFLRVDFLDYIEKMKQHPMSYRLGFLQKILFFFNKLHFFIFEIDLEILREAFDSMNLTYDKLKELGAADVLLEDYALILKKLQKSLIEYGHLD